MKNTYIIYEGDSCLDKKPIVAILTLTSNNEKLTGGEKIELCQLWFLKKDIDPLTASRTGEDFSICGNCKLRGVANLNKKSGVADSRGCYVLLYMRPLSLYKAIPELPRISMSKAKQLVKGKFLRVGAYGDSGSVPNNYINPLINVSKKFTGYSHQWESFTNKNLMASCETLEQRKIAKKKGYRTFRVLTDKSEISENEILCPASKESLKQSNCFKCGLCNGNKSNSLKDIAIVSHGGIKNNLNNIIRELRN
tara:strand:- start:676 stop:1431 length:756 start_codon:yes stop_codon:yes gene_type:complete